MMEETVTLMVEKRLTYEAMTVDEACRQARGSDSCGQNFGDIGL